MIEWNGRRLKTRRILLTVFIALALSHSVVGGLALSSSEEALSKARSQNSATEWALIRAQAEAAQFRAQLEAVDSELQQSKSELEETRIQQDLIQSSSLKTPGNAAASEFYEIVNVTEPHLIWNEWCECLTTPGISLRDLPSTYPNSHSDCPGYTSHQQIRKVCMIGSGCDGK